MKQNNMKKLKHLINIDKDNINVIALPEDEAAELVAMGEWKYTSKSKYRKIKKDSEKIHYPFNKSKFRSGGIKNNDKGTLNKNNFRVQIITKLRKAKKVVGWIEHEAKVYTRVDPMSGKVLKVKSGKYYTGTYHQSLTTGEVIRDEVINTIKHYDNGQSSK